MFLRIGIIGFAALCMFFSYILFSDEGKALNNIATSLGGANLVESDMEVSSGCMPRSMGNMYIKINTPKNFCSCMNDGLKNKDEILDSGSDLDRYKMMCIDVNYKEPSMRACKNINALLKKNKKKASVDCSCLLKEIKEQVYRIASYEGKYKDHRSSDVLTERFDQVVAINRGDGAPDFKEYFRLSKMVVERCAR